MILQSYYSAMFIGFVGPFLSLSAYGMFSCKTIFGSKIAVVSGQLNLYPERDIEFTSENLYYPYIKHLKKIVQEFGNQRPYQSDSTGINITHSTESFTQLGNSINHLITQMTIHQEARLPFNPLTVEVELAKSITEYFEMKTKPSTDLLVQNNQKIIRKNLEIKILDLAGLLGNQLRQFKIQHHQYLQMLLQAKSTLKLAAQYLSSINESNLNEYKSSIQILRSRIQIKLNEISNTISSIQLVAEKTPNVIENLVLTIAMGRESQKIKTGNSSLKIQEHDFLSQVLDLIQYPSTENPMNPRNSLLEGKDLSNMTKLAKSEAKAPLGDSILVGDSNEVISLANGNSLIFNRNEKKITFLDSQNPEKNLVIDSLDFWLPQKSSGLMSFLGKSEIVRRRGHPIGLFHSPEGGRIAVAVHLETESIVSGNSPQIQNQLSDEFAVVFLNPRDGTVSEVAPKLWKLGKFEKTDNDQVIVENSPRIRWKTDVSLSLSQNFLAVAGGEEVSLFIIGNGDQTQHIGSLKGCQNLGCHSLPMIHINELQESVQFIVSRSESSDGNILRFGQILFKEFQKSRLIRPSILDSSVQSGIGLVSPRGVVTSKLLDNWRTMIGILDQGNRGQILVVFDLKSGMRRLYLNLDRFSDPENSPQVSVNQISFIKGMLFNRLGRNFFLKAFIDEDSNKIVFPSGSYIDKQGKQLQIEDSISCPLDNIEN